MSDTGMDLNKGNEMHPMLEQAAAVMNIGSSGLKTDATTISKCEARSHTP